MFFVGTSSLRGRVVAALTTAACAAALWLASPLTGGAQASASAQPTPEVRALWVLRSSLASPASIDALVRSAKAHGFNTLLVQVRGRGDAYYASTLEPRAAELARQSSTFDPLATVVAAAHRAGLRVHAWVDVNLVSSAAELPEAREHVVYAHPEWLMVPRAIAQDLAKVDPVSPAYLGKIARWTRGESDHVEGLYASPILKPAADHVDAVVSDIARRYAVDGVHLDYIRYPNDEFDYSRFAIAAFRATIRPKLAPDVRREIDEQDRIDLFAYPDRFSAEWKAFRRDRLTDLMARLRVDVRNVRPDALVTIAAAPDAQEAADVRLQDWREWLSAGLVDAVCPMAYTQEPARFAEQIAAAREIAGTHAVWAGIGAYRLTPAQTIENIQTARRLGAAGFVLFSYDSLTGPSPPAADYLGIVSRGAFADANDNSSR
jgi:uncharacterized lipoprotein YddW (UPF0748 family)